MFAADEQESRILSRLPAPIRLTSRAMWGIGGTETGSSRTGGGVFEGSGGRSFEIEECFLAMVVTANTCWS